MFKKWIEDIRVKTKNMDKAQKWEYIMAYYWYHILIAFIVLVIAGIAIYHVTWGNPERLFSLAIVNQRVDYDRDEKLAEEFSISSGIKSRNIMVDSDYLLSYGDIKLDDVQVKESLFEKFFLGWQAGALDAVIMPESFFNYCIGKDGEFTGLLEICPDLLNMGSEESFYKYNDVYTGIYIDKTKIFGDFITDNSDPVILVFIKDGSHLKECRKFIEYVLRD